MSHDPKSIIRPVPSPKSTDPQLTQLRQELARMAKRRTAIASLWRFFTCFMFAIFAIVAGFIYLESRKPKPVVLLKPEVTKVELTPAETVPQPVVEAVTPNPVEVEPVIPPAPEVEKVVPEMVEVHVVTAAEQLDKEAVLVLTGLDSTREAAIKRDIDLYELAIKGQAWDAYRRLLARSIDAGMSQLPPGQGLSRFDTYWKSPIFYRAFLRWKTLGCFSESQISSLITDNYSAGMLTWLMNEPKAMEDLLLTITPEDDGSKVLKFLIDAWQMNEKNYQKYFPLTLACAVVFDRTVSIPHPIGNKDYVAEESVEPMQRYQWFIDKNEKGKLAVRLNDLTARDLIWVVCAPITTSELEWSLNKMNLKQKSWGNAYGMVKYLMERAVDGKNPYKEYSFAEILKEGGICGDQSYFCVNTARAQGIPAMTLSGETDLGGHAWAGIKIDDDEWTTGVGRVGGVSKGQAHDPQTGKSITEQDILLWNDSRRNSPNISISVWRHLWLADYFKETQNNENYALTVHLAHKLGTSFPETWASLYELLKTQTKISGEPPEPENLDEWVAFAKDMRREFKENPRMASLAADAETEYIFPYGSENDAKRTLARERRRVDRDSGEQQDLIAESLQREADMIAKRGGPNAKRDIGRLYDRALRDYGGSITGFKMMAENYFNFMKDDPDLASKAARDIELAFNRVVETGTTDYFRATTEASISKMIVGYYRAAGDEKRALMLEKRSEVLLKRAKRGASD